MSEHVGSVEEQQRFNSLGECNHHSWKVVPLPHLCALIHPSVCAGRCLWLTHRLLAEALLCLEKLPTTCTVAPAVTVKARHALALLSLDHYVPLLALAHNLFLKNVWLCFLVQGGFPTLPSFSKEHTQLSLDMRAVRVFDFTIGKI